MDLAAQSLASQVGEGHHISLSASFIPRVVTPHAAKGLGSKPQNPNRELQKLESDLRPLDPAT